LGILFHAKHKQFHIHMSSDSLRFIQQGTLLFTACITEQDLVRLSGTTLVSSSALAASSSLQSAHTPRDLALWHRRIMHHNVTGLLCLVHSNVAAGVAVNSPERPGPICEPCLAGKMRAKVFPSTGTVTTQLLGLIHANLAYLPVCTPSGYCYFVRFHDHASSNAFYPLPTKDQTFAAFCAFKVWAEKQPGQCIPVLQDNKGGKFVGGRRDVFFTLHELKTTAQRALDMGKMVLQSMQISPW
jgi:hypothetical protein